MPKLKVNGQEVEFQPGMTVLQACELAGAEIPRFCYHERLSIAGNCRMCLVEIEGGPPKPAASCAMPANEGMVVHTDTARVKKAREGVMEFLLINHPLDCPICDQGGECDLQDQSVTYGCGSSRFDENKRAVKDKYMGPLVKTHMTRCIHCTRCVRFVEEIAGVEEIGAIFRGEDMEITSYLEQSLTSELSANIIDLCPVGALTSKPYAFRARPWELKKTETIDVLDAVGSNIRVDARGREVMRVLPRLNEEINEEWISDKTRFACDGLHTQRLDRPYLRKDGKLQPVSWQEAFEAIAKKVNGLPGNKIAAIAGDLVDVESAFLLKELLTSLGSPHLDCRQDGAGIEPEHRVSYLFNTTIAGIEQADACLLIGTNPRVEAPLINARLRKRARRGGFKVAAIGCDAELTYRYEALGDDASILRDIESAKHPFAEVLNQAKKPMLIIGQDALRRPDADLVLGLAHKIAEKFALVNEGWNGFNVLHQAAGRVGALDVGFVPGKGGADVAGIHEAASAGKIDVVYLLGADEIDMSRLGHAFVIYQGHHGDAGAHRADVILPGAAYTEKDALYVNTEGRVQEAVAAVIPPGEAQQDWQILLQLATSLQRPFGYKHLGAIREKLATLAPQFAAIGDVLPADWQKFGKTGKLSEEPFAMSPKNFYMTDPISRASKTMAECTAAIAQGHSKEAA